LKESHYNSVRFELDATEAGLFTISFPYMPRFEADVDGETVPVYRTNGYQVGLLAPAGKHAITVRYTSPATCLGLLLSLATLFGLTLVLGFRVRHRYLRLLPPIAGAIAAASLFFAWNSSLYSGDNLGTRYTWRSDAFSPEDNIAYGRRTEMTGVKSHERPYDDYAGKGVDGIRKRGGFSSHKTRANQWWQVDLGAVRPIDRVVIYDRYSLSKHLPLLVQVSDNGKRFDTAVTLKKLTGPRQVEVDLAGRKTRYIRLKSSGKGGLSLKEIEVYGATPF
jgi:hypothetical protein